MLTWGQEKGVKLSYSAAAFQIEGSSSGRSSIVYIYHS